MIWDICICRIFTKYIFKEDNFTQLSKQLLIYQKANNIVMNYIDKDKCILQAIQFKRWKKKFLCSFFSYILLNLNPIGLDRKLHSDFERNQLKMIWDIFIRRIFTKYIFKEDNFTQLSKQLLIYQKANNIVMNYIDKDKQNIELLKLAIKNNLPTIQFCNSTLYPKIYARANAFGIQNKGKFDFVYSKWGKKCTTVYSNTYSKWTTVYSSAH